MKKSVTMREFIMLAALIIIIAYYFAVHVPMKNQMAEIEAQQIKTQDDIDSATARLLAMKSMQKELDMIFEQSGGNPPEIAEYNNSNQVLMELNSILGSAASYNIAFSEEAKTDYIVRREINMDYRATDYDTALEILTAIHGSPLRYLIKDLNLSAKSNRSSEDLFSVSVNIACFEYSPPLNSGAAAP